MIGNNKNVFWEALILTLIVFAIGLMIGIEFEKSKIQEISNYYSYSELAMKDLDLSKDLLESKIGNCEEIVNANIALADKVYEEAKLLSKYEDAGKINENMKLSHKRYDLLRTEIWINMIKLDKKCNNSINTVVYLYEYETEDLAKKATQNVWSKILFDLKQKKGSEIILLPIAADTPIASLNLLEKEFKINNLPSVIINNKDIVTELNSVSELENYLK